MCDTKLDRLALMKSTAERVAALYSSEELSDVVFMVGSELGTLWRYTAHRFILALASPVFRTMFASHLAEGKVGAEVKVTDMQPTAFENVLRYIYTNDLQLDSVRGALDTLYAAQKYMLYHLSSACMDFLETRVDRENVLEIFQEVKLYDLELGKGKVILKCLQTMDKDAAEVLRSQAFGSLDLATVRMILSREFLQVPSELPVFNAAIYWATQECRRHKLELSAENKRHVLGKSLYLIQYLSMSREEFLEGPSASGLLSDEECRALLAKIYGDETVPLPSSLRKRQLKWKRNLYYCYPVKFFRKEPNTFVSHNQEETVIIAVSHDIVLMGFDLYGPKLVGDCKSYVGELHLIVADMFGNIIGEVCWKAGHTVPLKDGKLCIEFGEAVFLKSRKKYRIQLFLSKGEYQLGENWQGTTTSKYKCRSIDFAIKYCGQRGNNGSLMADDLSDDESFGELDSGSEDEPVSSAPNPPTADNVSFPGSMPNDDPQEVFIHSLFHGVKFYF